MADYEVISRVIINAIRKEVDKQIDAAYRRGYADGKARIEPTKAEKEQIYNHGLDKAWEYARKIVSCEIPWEVFGLRVGQSSDKAIFNYTASEAIAKIKEYEEKERCKECKYPLMNPLCGVGNETCNRKQEYEERQTEKCCLTCGHCHETEDERLYCEIAVEKPMSCTDYAQWTPKQDEIHCNATDKEITGSFIEDVSAVKDQLPYKSEYSYRNNRYYNTFPTSKETADKIKAEYDEETRSYTYTVNDDNDDITIDQAIDNIKRGYGIPHKHKTLALAIKALRMMKEKSPIIQAYADVERQI